MIIETRKMKQNNFPKIKCSVGICAYNEEKNIERLMDSIIKQKLNKVQIEEIIIIASGITDRTIEILRVFAQENGKIKIIVQKNREGKASAVNLFIQIAKNEVLVLLGGDLILGNLVIERLVWEFSREEVGMTGARPVPVNNINDGICGFAAHLLWQLHHQVSLEHPKMGEVIAFRKVFRRIPVLSSVDEANIEPLIRGQGYLIRYIPQAKIYNKAPESINEFIKQRRRIYSGHLAVKNEQSYEVSTMRLFAIMKALGAFLKHNGRPKHFLYIPCVIFLEGYSRFLGWWDYTVVKERHTMWDVVESTKNLDS